MYSRLHFDDVMTQGIYGRFWLSSSTHLGPNVSHSPSLVHTPPTSCDVVRKQVPISPDLWRVAGLFPSMSHVAGWKEKSWTGVLRMYQPVWEQRVMCGLLVSSKDPMSHSVQTRADTNRFCFENVPLLLCWTACSDLINKALFLNKTLKDGSFNIFRVQWD